MGLAFPTGARIYVDTAILIYSVERHPQYWPILDMLWTERFESRVSMVTSELTVMEVLVGPIKARDERVLQAYRRVMDPDNVQLVPITLDVLERAAEVRASSRLKTPDAIHAATALEVGTDLFLTNDRAFRAISALQPLLLDDVVSEVE